MFAFSTKDDWGMFAFSTKDDRSMFASTPNVLFPLSYFRTAQKLYAVAAIKLVDAGDVIATGAVVAAGDAVASSGDAVAAGGGGGK